METDRSYVPVRVAVVMWHGTEAPFVKCSSSRAVPNLCDRHYPLLKPANAALVAGSAGRVVVLIADALPIVTLRCFVPPLRVL